jgi:hypothetical protein
MSRIAIFLVLLLALAANAFAQAPVIIGGGSPAEIVLMVNGNVYLRIAADGSIKTENGARFTIGSTGTSGQFTTEDPPNSFPTATLNETLLKNDLSGAGVLAVKNSNVAGYSAYTARASTGHEVFAFGYGNASVGPAIFQDANYIETWSGVSTAAAPKRLVFAADGNYGSVGSNFRFYQRQSIETDGGVKWWKLIPSGTSQVETMSLLPNGGLGIGLATPITMLHLKTQNALQAAVTIDEYSLSPAVIGRKANGGVDSATAAVNTNTLLSLAAYGYESAAFATVSAAVINAVATETHSSTAHGSRFDFLVTPDTSTTKAVQMSIRPTQWIVGSMVTPASSGTRYLCISTAGVITSSASACSGT